ncbi:MAG: DNA polymerase III subunit delta' [Rhodothermales bacterium]
MGWEKLLDQVGAQNALRHSIENDRVSHAYLFFGPDGSGKRAAALLFAQSLLCLNRAAGQADPCETCAACLKVKRMTHPDVHFLMPYPGEDPPDDFRKRLDMLAVEPYRTLDYSRRPSIDDLSQTSNKQTIYEVRRVHDELIREMSFRPVEGAYKIAIITDADRLQKAGANAFLKRLEEPFADTIFILLTVRPDRLLPTIVSRTQKVQFDRIATDTIARYLTSIGTDASDAALISRMSDGSLSRAIDLADHSELRSGREVVVDFLRVSFVDDADATEEAVRLLAGQGREQVKLYLQLLLAWIRDLLILRQTGDESTLVNVDQIDAIRSFVAKLPDADVARMVSLIEEGLHLVERNVNATSVLRSLGIGLRDAMKGRPGGNLYQPLARTSSGFVAKSALA